MLIQIQHRHLQFSVLGPNDCRTFPDWCRRTASVPLDNVLWTEGAPHYSHIRYRPRYMGLAPEDSRGAYVRGSIKDGISFYITGPEPTAAKAMGFWGSKVPLPYDPDEGMKKRGNIERASGMTILSMALNVQCTIEPAMACFDLNIDWSCILIEYLCP